MARESGRSRASRETHRSAVRDTGTLGKAISVLETVAEARGPLRFSDILRASSQPRGTLHRQIANLVKEGLLAAAPEHGYELGLRLLQLASRAWSGNQFRKVAEPHLAHLHEETGETVHLGVLSSTQVVYLDKVESRQAVRMHSQIGNSSPLYCTGVGKAALSAVNDAQFEDILGRIALRKFTPSTITDAAALRAEIASIRASGIAFDREEHEVGIRCVAAPVFSKSRHLAAGVSVTGPAYRVSMSKLREWSGVVRNCAAGIMEDMECA